MDKIKSLNRRNFAKIGLGSSSLLQSILPVASLTDSFTGGNRISGCCLMQGGEKLIAQSRLSKPGKFEGLLNSSGDIRFDRSLGILLVDLSQKFQVRPGFGYFDDLGSPNALALPQSQFSNSRGTVLFGREMLSRYKNSSHGDMFIMGICAHEFAHIVQFFSGFYERLAYRQKTNKLVELHADFLSGYYIGLRKLNYTKDELLTLGKSWETIGDSNYTDSQHHGTSEERLRAVEQGYLIAKDRPEFGINTASEVGARYLHI